MYFLHQLYYLLRKMLHDEVPNLCDSWLSILAKQIRVLYFSSVMCIL
mgnify:CR=1 FL=1